MSNGTKREMTAEEFCKLWALTEKYDVNDPTHNKLIEICLSDLRSVIRGELVKYTDMLNRKMLELNVCTRIEQEDLDEFLNNNSVGSGESDC